MRSDQHVSGNLLRIFRSKTEIYTAYGILQRWIDTPEDGQKIARNMLS